MVFLFGAIASSALFTQSCKFVLARRYDVVWVSIPAFGFSALCLALSGRLATAGFAWGDVILGAVYADGAQQASGAIVTLTKGGGSPDNIII